MEKKSESLGFKDICLLLLMSLFKSLNIVFLCVVLDLSTKHIILISIFYSCEIFFGLMERVVSDRRIWNNTVDIHDLRNEVQDGVRLKSERTKNLISRVVKLENELTNK